MRSISIATALFMALASATSLQSRANPKANEYTEPDCLNISGGTKPSWGHAPGLCGCVTIDITTATVYIATSPSQDVHAFKNGACNPGKDKEDYLGQVGGPCLDIADQFTAGPVQSILFEVPFICDIVDLIKGDPVEAMVDLLKDIIEV